MSGADAVAQGEAGADLVQIYTGFIYGPPLVTEAARAAGARLRACASLQRDAGLGLNFARHARRELDDLQAVRRRRVRTGR